jgi:SAM-dependent methyltransferase
LHRCKNFEILKTQAPQLFDTQTENDIKGQALKIASAFFGHIASEHVAFIGSEMREHFMCLGLNSRQRAMMELVFEVMREKHIPESEIKIYGHEAITAFALFMRGRFPKYVGTEFCRDAAERDRLFPIAHGDICALDFPDQCFNVVVSNDVLEHVPDIDAALRETARILKPGGAFLATFPFFFERDKGARFASLVDGKNHFHILPPIYHGNPMSDEGSLVYEIPGWDILGRARAAGFGSAVMRLICSASRGYARLPWRSRPLQKAFSSPTSFAETQTQSRPETTYFSLLPRSSRPGQREALWLSRLPTMPRPPIRVWISKRRCGNSTKYF